VLARQQEFEADRMGADVTSAQAAASSLIRGRLLGEWLHESFWPTLYRQADTRDRPTILPYRAMATAFRMSHDEWATPDGLCRAWPTSSTKPGGRRNRNAGATATATSRARRGACASWRRSR